MQWVLSPTITIAFLETSPEELSGGSERQRLKMEPAAPSREELREWVLGARQWTLDCLATHPDDELHVPCVEILNPPLWEVGHVAWFQEKWVLRHRAGHRALRKEGDRVFDSAAVFHDARWENLLPSREETIAYLKRTRDRTLQRIEDSSFDDEDRYFVMLSVFHEDMHAEALIAARQICGRSLPSPWCSAPVHAAPVEEPLASEEVEIPAGTYWVGAPRSLPFAFDNEKWAHPVKLSAFRMDGSPVRQEQFLQFVESGGYQEGRWWSEAGLRWKEAEDATAPAYWIAEPNAGWSMRWFDQQIPLSPRHPVMNVNWFEAEAYCRWAGRRLPTEFEWEVAASWAGDHAEPRVFPWGHGTPTAETACLESTGPVSAMAHAQGDSAAGCRQMIGGVWEWTSSPFRPYPEFVCDPYKEYSEPWFDSHFVLRGGSWATRRRLIRNSWRNFYLPHRRDLWTGFRTCALDP